MAPSAVNDSARALMAAAAKFRDDNAGALTTGGTSTAYTLTSNQVFATLTAMNGMSLTVRFDETNGAAPTLNVDSLGAKAIQTASGTAVGSGVLLANSVHNLTYDNSIPAFLVHGIFAAQPLDAELTALAGLTSAADKGIQFTGSGAAGTYDLTTAGKNLLDDADAGAQRTTLGLGTSAIVNTGTSGATIPLLNGNNTYSGTATFSGTTSVTNSAGVAARNTVKAFGKVINATLQTGSFNVASVTDAGQTHAVAFTSAMGNTNYIVLLTLDSANANESITLAYEDIATGGFTVNGYIAAIGATDPDSYSFMVLSNE
jgi:hypothetical protein